ncbi:MAG: tetratricopeptide repeat protein [Candidatus Ozemobacteraceae bacterium]
MSEIQVAQNFPYPIACVYAELDNPHASFQTKQTALYFTVYQLMRSVTLPFISAYLHKGGYPKGLDKKRSEFNQTLIGLRSPFFSSWIAMLNKIAECQSDFDIAIFDQAIAFHHKAKTKGQIASFWDLMKTIGGKTEKVTVSQHYALEQGAKRNLTLFEAFLGLRNGTAHAGRSLDSVCAEDILFFRPLLDKLLSYFQWLEHCSLLELDGPIAYEPELSASIRVLKGAEPPPARILSISETLCESFREESPLVMRIPQPNGASPAEKELCIPMYPLLFGRLEGEPVQLYDGHYIRNDEKMTRRTIHYLGSGKRMPVDDDDRVIVFPEGYQKSGEKLLGLLKKQDVQWELSKEDVKPWTLQDCANDFSRRTFADQINTKYLPECYLERDVPLRALRQFTLESPVQAEAKYPYRAMIVTGGAGSGKTALLMHLADQILKENKHVVFFLRGDGFTVFESEKGQEQGNMLFQNVAHKIGLKTKDFSGFSELFSRLRDGLIKDQQRDEGGKPNRRLIFLFDAVNEAPRFERLVGEIDGMVKDARNFPFVRIVFTVRSEAFSVMMRKKGEGEIKPFSDCEQLILPNPDQKDQAMVSNFGCSPLAIEEAAVVYKKYQDRGSNKESPTVCLTKWEHLKEPTQKLLCNPLYLHLFHATFAGRDAEGVSGTPGELFEAFLAEKCKRVVGFAEASERISKVMLKNRRPDFTDDDSLKLRQEWQSEKGLGEGPLRSHFSPMELCEMEGIVQKRVREEGGGFRIPFQVLREFLLFQEFQRLYPGLPVEKALEWDEKVNDFPELPEYSAVLWFLMRRYSRENRFEDAARLYAEIESTHEASVRHLTNALRNEILLDEGQNEPKGVGFAVKMIDSAKNFNVTTASEFGVRIFDNLHDALIDDALRSTIAEILRANLDIFETIVRQKPNDSSGGVSLGTSYLRLGRIESQRGNLDQAIELYKKCLTISEALFNLDPSCQAVTRNLRISCNGLADFEIERGNLDPAAEWVQKAIRFGKEIFQLLPNSVDGAQGFHGSIFRLGKIEEKRGNLDEAFAMCQKGLKISEDLYRRTPDCAEATYALSNSYQRLAAFEERRRNLDGAFKLFEKGLKIRDDLYRRTPDSALAARVVSDSYEMMAHIAERRGNIDRAFELYQNGLKIREDLYRRTPDDAEIAFALSCSYGSLAGIEEARGNLNRASELYQKGLGIFEDLYHRNPESIKAAVALSASNYILGNFSLAHGDSAEAKTWWRKSRDLLRDMKKREKLIQPNLIKMLDSLEEKNLGDSLPEDSELPSKQGNVPLVPLSGSLFISWKPDGEVFIDGNKVASSTPAAIKTLSSGIHLIEIKKAGFETFSQNFETKSGELFRLENIVLKPIPMDGSPSNLSKRLTESYSNVPDKMNIQGKSQERWRAFLTEKEELLTAYTGVTEGIEYMEKLLLEEPQNVDFLDWLAFAYYANNEIDKAIDTNKRVLSIKPNNVDNRYNLANSLFKKGKYNEAAEEWLEVIRLKPASKIAENAEKRINFVKQYWSLLDLGEDSELPAKQTDVLLVPLPGSLFVSWKPEGEVFIDGNMAASSTPAAIINLSPGIHLIEIKKTGFETFSQNFETQPGEIFRLENIVLYPIIPEKVKIQGISQERWRTFLMEREELLTKYTGGNEGIEDVEKLLLEEPQNVDLLDWLASMYFGNKEFDKAIETFKRALSIRPNNENQHYHLANSLFKKGKYNEAAEEWLEVIRLKPASKIAKNARGRIDFVKKYRSLLETE